MLILLASIMFSLTSPAASLPRIEVQGHRGARGMRPENTLPAFTFAIENDVDTLELDLAVSEDARLVISHDPALTPERCLGPDGQRLKEAVNIHDLSYEKIKAYDCGSLGNERFPKQVPVPHTPKPLLEDLFALVESSPLPGAKTVRFNIETKIYPSRPDLTPDPTAFVRLLLTVARQHHMLSRIILQSFDDRTLIAAKKLEPRLATSLLTSDNHLDFVAAAKSAHANIISPDHEWILPEDVRRLHKAGIRVLPWTVNDPQGWQRLIDMGVDGIISDYPVDLIAYLKKLGRR